MFTAPLGRWRRASVSERRTAIDWAMQMRVLLDEDYPEAKKILLVCDNLNTHTRGAFYQAFAPATARRLVKRVEIHYTPKHGSWLNVAECELSVLSRHCLRNRTPTLPALRNKVEPWCSERNTRQRGVNWQFTTEDARIKLKHLYPEIQLS